MHACRALTLEQLLSLRDCEPIDAVVRIHAESCTACQAEVERLRAMELRLKSLPSLAPPVHDMSGIRARLRAQRTLRAATVVGAIGVGVLTLALIASVTGLRSYSEVDSSVSVASVSESPARPQNVSSLVIRSQELESRLQRLPRRPHIERAGTSATIDSLQSRIQWLDYQLSLASDVGMTESQSAELWQNRIQLMDSLVKVRSAEAQRAVVLSTGGVSSYQASFVR